MGRLLSRILAGLALASLAALLIIPQTRQMITYPLLAARDIPLLHQQTRDARTRQLAAATPDNFGIQYAAAVQTENKSQVQILEEMRPAFPTSPALDANLLSMSCLGVDHLGNAPTVSLLRQSGTSAPAPAQRPAVQLASFVQDARRGEKLAPDNAFFPWMLAIGLAAQGKQAAAQTALLAAGTKPDWQEYTTSRIFGTWQLNQRLYGFFDAIAEGAISASQLYPQYAVYRSFARDEAKVASTDEQTGEVQRGIAISQALIHCGSLMRVDSPTLIGSLNGTAIASIAMDRQASARLPTHRSPLTPAEQQAKASGSALQYADFLKANHDSAAAGVALAEQRANMQARTISQKAPNILFGYVQRSMTWLIILSTVLANLLWLLLILTAARARVMLTGAQRANKALLAVAYIFGALIFAGCGLATSAFTFAAAVSVHPTNQLSIASGYLRVLWLALAPLAVLIIAMASERAVPFSRRLVAASVPILCLVTIVFSSVIVGTAFQEQAANKQLFQQTQSEGRFVAQQAGQTWPGLYG